jgi:hypothetical protein
MHTHTHTPLSLSLYSHTLQIDPEYMFQKKYMSEQQERHALMYWTHMVLHNFNKSYTKNIKADFFRNN